MAFLDVEAGPQTEAASRAACDDFARCGAAADDPHAIIGFRPARAAQVRLHFLMERERAGVLTPAERQEMDLCLNLEHEIRMAKIRARVVIAPPDH